MHITDSDSYHATLAKSYVIYLIFSIGGLAIDTVIHSHFNIAFARPTALILFATGTFLVIWAQYTSRHTRHSPMDHQRHYFMRGPYHYLRNPTQLGILLLIGGYTILSQSFVFFLVSVLAYVISNTYFRKYEQLLQDEYGREYTDYKQEVKKIL